MHLRQRPGVLARSGALGAALLASTLAGCAAPPGPAAAVAAYREAVARGDAEAVLRWSDAATRAAVKAEEVETQLAGDAAGAASTAEALGRPVVREATELELEGGRRVGLVREADGWRVATGGLGLDRNDTPENALGTFLRAVTAKRLALVRRLIPEAARERFTSDAALAAHLEAVAPRIEAARRRHADAPSQAAEILGEEAHLEYPDGTKITFLLGPAGWTILDLE